MGTDEEDFDATDAKLTELRKTPEWKNTVSAIEAKARTTAQGLWAVASPVLQAAGKAAMPIALHALEGLAMSALTDELDKLSGRKP